MNATDLRRDLPNDHLDDRIDRALRSLDVGGIVTDTDRIRAEASLERILATPAGGSAGVAGAEPVRRRSLGRRLAWLLPATATAALVGAVMIPAMTGTDPKAFASWTRTPSAVAAQDLEDARRACMASLRDWEQRGTQAPDDERPDIRPQTAKLVAAERRGEYVFVALATESGASITCLSEAGNPGGVSSAGGSPTAMSPKPPALAPTQVEAPGAGTSTGPDGAFAFTMGRVGTDVRAITLHAGSTVIDATVGDGWFAAWWPVEKSSVDRVGAGAPYEEPTVDVTLADGSVLKDAPVTGPGRHPNPGPRQLGHIERGGGVSSQGAVATAGGLVGSDVVGVRIHVAGREVTATVEDGRFSAEWPTARQGDSGGPATYDLTLRDGTVLTDVKPLP